MAERSIQTTQPPSVDAAAAAAGQPLTDERAIQRLVSSNKKSYLAYNRFRKRLFRELSPDDSRILLFGLPWLLCVNHSQCPGFLAESTPSFWVYGIDNDPEIRSYEPHFKRMFGIQKTDSLLRQAGRGHIIQGIYTIGSSGSVGQATHSDCDIWICIDKVDFDDEAWLRLQQKINLIKDWLDGRLKAPVFFFVSDVSAIQRCRFASLGKESSGRTQQRILKEEFYRTCMTICGKIPLWWLCHHSHAVVDYSAAVAAAASEEFWEYDIIDLGDLRSIDKEEYLGATLWQLHKSLTHPLKSIVKMGLLQMQLIAPESQLLCHQFRRAVYDAAASDMFPDVTIFTMDRIAAHFAAGGLLPVEFLIECFYIRCEFNPYHRRHQIKNRLCRAFLKKYPIDSTRQVELRRCQTWKLRQKLDFGRNIFKLLLQLFTEISAQHAGHVSKGERKDLTVLGRRISAYYTKKHHKVQVLQVPFRPLVGAGLNIVLSGDHWHAFCGDDLSTPLIFNEDIVHVLAFMVWNDLFLPDGVHMRPNPSDVTMREVNGIARNIQMFFGSCQACGVDFSDYLKTESVIKVMMIVGLEQSPWYDTRMDIRLLWMNCWGELFVRRFESLATLEQFIGNMGELNPSLHTSYYIRRNSTQYEKIIERAKQLLVPSLRFPANA